MSEQQFLQLMSRIAGEIAGMPVGATMEQHLNARFPADGEDFAALKKLCGEGEAEGWLMNREAGGIRFGRAIKPGNEAGDFSVDVVRMKDVRGPHHIHTNGEIGAILPISGDPRFDRRGAGWYVYQAGSDHHPTVEGGDAYVVYLLPGGAIEFTGR